MCVWVKFRRWAELVNLACVLHLRERNVTNAAAFTHLNEGQGRLRGRGTNAELFICLGPTGSGLQGPMWRSLNTAAAASESN